MKRIALGSALFTLVLASAATAQDTPPPIIFGQYMRCNLGQESRADEIVRTVWGPVAQKHVDSGQLSSWGFWRTFKAAHGVASSW